MADVPVIEEYSPNICWGKQHVEIVLQQWQYEARFVELVGGNCLGVDVMEAAFGNLYDRLEGDPVRVRLTAPNGDTLLCEDEHDRGDEWLKEMCVSIRIVAYDPPTVNEVRARNGVEPLPDGDRLVQYT